MALHQQLTNEQVMELLYNHTDSPLDTTDTHEYPPLPDSPMDDTPSQNPTNIEPLTRKRPISPNDDGFTTVRHKSSRGGAIPKAPVAVSAPTPTSNSFSPLQSVKPPPIILPLAMYDQSAVTSYIRRNAGVSDYKIQSTKQEVKIFCSSFNEYEKILSVFKNPDSQVMYYTYARKGQGKNKKYIILGLDLSHPMDSIKESLKHQHLIDVRRMTKTDKSGRKTPIEPILVTFSPEYDYNGHMKKIKHIDNIIIYHKIFKDDHSIPQCHRCQRFGHTKNHCNMEHRCVRCSGNHPVEKCQRDTTPLLCANCGLEHPASYRGCEFRNKLLQTLQQKKAEKSRPPPTYIPAPAPSHNAWGKPLTTSHPPPQTSHLSTIPPTLPLPTPQTHPQPLLPLIPHPPVDPNTPPRWVADLTNNITNMFNAIMTSVNRLVDALTSLLVK